nr:hypothetical protein [Tardiphaga robiniae]
MASAIVFAVANQAGNAGWTIVACGLVVAGAGFAVYTVRTSSE